MLLERSHENHIGSLNKYASNRPAHHTEPTLQSPLLFASEPDSPSPLGLRPLSPAAPAMSSEPLPAESPEAPASSSGSPSKDAVGTEVGAAAGSPETNTLWVGNLPSHVTEGDLLALFGPHGALDCALARAGSRSYAFVLFRSPAEAREAVEATRGEKVKGAAMRTEFARPVI